MKKIIKKSLAFLLLAAVLFSSVSIMEENQLIDYLTIEAEAAISGEEEIKDLKNGWFWPVPYTKKLSSTFGLRYMNNEKEYHQGIDICCSNISGKEIYAARSGVVVLTGKDGSMGNYVHIKHGKTSDGKYVFTTYMHMKDTPLVKKGDIVDPFTVLGYVGSTGESSGNHLHFQIFINTVSPNERSIYGPSHKSQKELNQYYINPDPEKKMINYKDISIAERKEVREKKRIESIDKTFVTSINNANSRKVPYYEGAIINVYKEKGTEVHAVAQITNLRNHIWYQLDDGSWIFSERVTEKPLVKVNFNATKGSNIKTGKKVSGIPPAQAVKKGEECIVQGPVPKLEGYTFLGYARTQNAKQPEFQIGQSLTASDEDIQLYPVWKQEKVTMSLGEYTVNFDKTGKDNVRKTISAVVKGNLNKSCKEFSAVSDNTKIAEVSVSDNLFDNNIILSDKLTAKVNITAKAPGSATIVVTVNNNDNNNPIPIIRQMIHITVTEKFSVKIYDDSDSVVIQQQKIFNKDLELSDYVPEKSGYFFEGWTSKKGSSTVEYGPSDIYKANAPLNLYPVWMQKEEITYSFNSGTLTITGAGKMPSYPTEKTPWSQDKTFTTDQIKKIIIEYGITTIGSNAFANLKNVKEVEIPNSIWRIGSKAFYNTAITRVVIPASVQKLGNRAFSKCTQLVDVLFEDNVSTAAIDSQAENTSLKIGAFAFENCVSLASVEIPDNATELGAGAFTGCSAMETVTIPDSVETIEDTAFFGCSSLEAVEIPEGVIEIGDGAFSGCSAAETIIIPDTVEKIGDQAFSGCSAVSEVIVPDSVDTMGSGVFTNCSALTKAELPEDCDFISDGMFSGCSALVDIEGIESVEYIGDGAFRYCSSLTEFEIPENVSQINDGTFWGCSSLKNFVIPASVVTIGDYAFSSCDGLKKVSMSEGTTTIGIGAFAFCSSLEDVSVPSSVTLIDDGAFMECSSLKKVELLESKLSIGKDTFSGCSALERIDLPQGIVSVGENAFNGCSSNFTVSCFSDSSVCDQMLDTVDNINVIYPVTGVSLNKTKESMFGGETLQLSASIAPQNATDKNVSWFSNHPEVATVDENGLVTAIKTGTVVITATTNDNLISAQCEITVTVPVKSIEIVDEELSGYVEENMQIYFNIEPNNSTNISVSWISSDESIATVNDNGEVLLLSPGEVTITAITEDGGFTDSCIIKSEEFIMPTGVNLAEKNIEMTVGEVRELQAQTVPSNTSFPYIFWEAEENTDIVEVSQDGIITALKEGTATVYAYAGSFDGPVEACSVTVLPNSSSSNIEICKPSVTTIDYGDAIILHVDGTVPAGARIEWTASNGNFSVSVSADGTTCKISPKSSGKTVFTATVYDKEGNLIGTDTQEMTAKAGLWQKIVAFFKKIFGLTKTFPEAFKGIL